MAYIQRMTTYALLLTLFTCQMLFGEGRQIKSPSGGRISYTMNSPPIGSRKLGSLTAKSDHNDISSMKTVPQPSATIASLTSKHSSPRRSLTAGSFEANNEHTDNPGSCPGVRCLDDFQSRVPGHSPAAGHSFPTSRNNPPDQITKNQETEYTTSESEDDYRRTSPGRSPGAGHAIEEGNTESNPETAELQSTFLSSSPARRSFFSDSTESNKNEFRPPSLPTSGDLATNQKDTDTSGHCLSKKCSRNNLPDQKTKYQETEYTPSESDDDYRRTSPGRSPGAGHAVEDGNTESNPKTAELQSTSPSSSQADRSPTIKSR